MEIASGSGNLIEGNYIGTNAAGTAGVGNTFAGVEILDAASNNMIGGGTSSGSNIIAYNGTLGNAGSGGVIIGDAGTATIPVGNAVEYNSIFSNNGLGISLGSGGANNAIAAPIISSVTTTVSATAITLHLTQAVGSKIRIEVYSSATNAAGQGQTLVLAGVGVTVPARCWTVVQRRQRIDAPAQGYRFRHRHRDRCEQQYQHLLLTRVRMTCYT